MNAGADSALWIQLSCFVLSLVSAILPWTNGEVIVISLAAFLRSGVDLTTLAVVAAAGQMTGKALTYWAAREGLAPKPDRQSERIARWRRRFEEAPRRSLALMLVSAVAGVPPFYLITILAGALRVPFGRFLIVGTCGRLLHFGAVVFAPTLARGLLR
jgi:membrane protein YqaA with SNARE-associated domain